MVNLRALNVTNGLSHPTVGLAAVRMVQAESQGNQAAIGGDKRCTLAMKGCRNALAGSRRSAGSYVRISYTNVANSLSVVLSRAVKFLSPWLRENTAVALLATHDLCSLHFIPRM